MIKNFECKQCGSCCKKLKKLIIDPLDIILWQVHKKEELLDFQMKGVLDDFKGKGCIFLTMEKGKSTCQIHEYKPKMCRTFPASKAHALFSSDCEGVKPLLNCMNCHGKIKPNNFTALDCGEILPILSKIKGSSQTILKATNELIFCSDNCFKEYFNKLAES